MSEKIKGQDLIQPGPHHESKTQEQKSTSATTCSAPQKMFLLLILLKALFSHSTTPFTRSHLKLAFAQAAFTSFRRFCFIITCNMCSSFVLISRICIFQSIVGAAQLRLDSGWVPALAPADLAELAHTTMFKQTLQVVCSAMSGEHNCLRAAQSSTTNN